MAKSKIEIQDENANVYYPHTSADVVYFADGSTVQTVKPTVATITLTTSGWTGSVAPYTQAITVNGIIKTSTTESLLYVSPVNTAANVGLVGDCGITATALAANRLTFTAAESKPTASVQFLVANAGVVKI